MHTTRVTKTATQVLKNMANSMPKRSLATISIASINPRVLQAQYAVRGELVIRADAIKTELNAAKAAGEKNPKRSFDSVVLCNIGNPQELGQAPLTFYRQVLACMQYPELLKEPTASQLFPKDVIVRTKEYLQHFSGGMGAYTNSVGVLRVRQEVAEFVSRRDGHPASADNIFLTNGASGGVNNVLNMLIRSSNDGVLTPLPQYPLYSATLSLLHGHAAGYYLDESTGWSLNEEELERSLKTAKEEGIDVRALVVINPGNPTGQVLPENIMRGVVNFCVRHHLVLMADEVYQENVYQSRPFISFKKIVTEMKAPVSLFSFHSVSKGFLGECGQRGGYVELTNVPDDVRMQLYKLQSISLCGNTSGQVVTGLMVNPPKPGDASYELYKNERDSIIASLKRRAIRVAEALNKCEGISCQPVEGAMYAFPQVELPAKAIAAAEAAGKNPDTFYCLALLESTGMCVVPGSGFGQVEGTFHFRTTILPPEKDLDNVMTRFASFHQDFMIKYR